MVKVHYFFDPMCGWCYGATSLIQALAEAPEFELLYHPGGMMPKRAIEPAFRRHILQADERIEVQTHATFGEAYKARVADSETFVLDSYLTTRAFMVGQQMGVLAHVMLRAIQEAHYQNGEALEEPENLKKLALSLGLNEEEWERHMANSESDLSAALDTSHELMRVLRVSSYPTLMAELGNDTALLPISTYYGNVSGWKEFLTTVTTH